MRIRRFALLLRRRIHLDLPQCATTSEEAEMPQNERRGTMQGTSTEDRKKELRALLDQIEAHPSQPLKAERERVVVLQKMLAADAQAK